ncbi:helix-turn-helix transcriptional regulator [Streptomyces sp. V4-01]|uniref:Helix-turn-helix transcriptional regulator n=1 Tax=Actinacidiphila polyblastidii TaxID=3110430 RepID=A0ABU7PKN0_9ACTN|nr:helix-turn-helix transcriptional regulator [Streptomyces sp. V4-01]
MTTAAEAALRRVLAVFDLLIDAVDEDDMVPALMPLLLAAVPGDSIVWAPHPAPGDRVCLPGDLVTPEAAAAFARGAGEDPLVAHTVAGPGTPARRSDLQSRAETLAMPVYGEVYRPLGAEHQLAMAFPAGYADGARRRVCLVVNRRTPDFADRDLETAGMLRVRLAHALGRLAPRAPQVPPAAALAPSARDQVTRREAAVLALLCRGLTNEQIGHRLDISPRTVDKHLEHAYPKLRAGGRVAAANAWRAGSATR